MWDCRPLFLNEPFQTKFEGVINDLNRQTVEKFLYWLTKKMNGWLLGMTVGQLTLFSSTYLFAWNSFWLTFLLVLATLLLFFIGKDFATEEDKRRGFILFQANIVLFLFNLTNIAILFLSKSVGAVGSSRYDSIFNLGFFALVLVSVFLFAMTRYPTVKQQTSNIYEVSLLAKLGFATSPIDTTIGDVKLGIDKTTQKSVLLKFKDRFLHMLILGPTGSGKTSQIILPMIYQDIQNMNAGITVIEPKSDLAEKVYMMGKKVGRDVLYFNPILPNCPYFNPLHGKEEDVIENTVTTFKMLNPDSPQFFLDMNENLLRNALKVLKRSFGDDATLIDLHRLISNPDGAGRKTVMEFVRKKSETPEMAKENADIAAYFLNDYFNEKSKTYEHCSGVRTQVSKITSNKYLRKVLNPPAGMNDIDFDAHLANGGIIAIATAQGKLRDLGRFLGYFIILQFQSSVFRRPGNENTRRAHFLYIDEFQVYANPGFADMLTQGRSYRVASQLATQNRALIGMGRGQEGKDFIELVSTNARNIVIFPGGNALDAKYYSEQFGEMLREKVQKGISRSKFNLLYGFQSMNYPQESIRYSEEMEARFSTTDIMFRPFGEVTYLIIKDNSIQEPSVAQIEYIPKELNDELDAMIEEYSTQIEQETGEPRKLEEKPDADTDLTITYAPITETSAITAPIKVLTKKEEMQPAIPIVEDAALAEGEDDDFGFPSSIAHQGIDANETEAEVYTDDAAFMSDIDEDDLI
jgi:hypothetical protein